MKRPPGLSPLVCVMCTSLGVGTQPASGSRQPMIDKFWTGFKAQAAMQHDTSTLSNSLARITSDVSTESGSLRRSRRDLHGGERSLAPVVLLCCVPDKRELLQVVKNAPHMADAWHLGGVAMHQQGRSVEVSEDSAGTVNSGRKVEEQWKAWWRDSGRQCVCENLSEINSVKSP